MPGEDGQNLVYLAISGKKNNFWAKSWIISYTFKVIPIRVRGEETLHTSFESTPPLMSTYRSKDFCPPGLQLIPHYTTIRL